MRFLIAISCLPTFLTAALALPNPFHRCHHTPTQPTEESLRPLPTSALFAGALSHGSPSEIASLIKNNHGDLGGEEPIPRKRRRPHAEMFEEDFGDFGDPVVKIRRSLWNLLGFREWVVSIEWKVPGIPKAVFRLEREETISEVGWERQEFVQSEEGLIEGDVVEEDGRGLGAVMLDL